MESLVKRVVSLGDRGYSQLGYHYRDDGFALLFYIVDMSFTTYSTW
jgi:hypothetical protein